MAKRTKKQKRKDRERRKKQPKLIHQKVEELPAWDVVDACGTCDARIRLWNSGFAVRSQECCRVHLTGMMIDREKATGIKANMMLGNNLKS